MLLAFTAAEITTIIGAVVAGILAILTAVLPVINALTKLKEQQAALHADIIASAKNQADISAKLEQVHVAVNSTATKMANDLKETQDRVAALNRTLGKEQEKNAALKS